MYDVRADPLVRSIRLLELRPVPMVRAVGLGAASSLCALALAGFSAWLITRAWQMPPVLSLSVAVTSVRALGVSRAVLRYAERLATHDVALRAVAAARTGIYRAVATGSSGYAVTVRRSDVVSRSGSDVDDVADAMIRAVVPIGAATVSAVAAVVVMSVISPWAGAVTAVGWLVAAVVAPAASTAAAARAHARAADAHDRAVDLTTTVLWHAPELEVAGRRAGFLSAVGDAQTAAARADVGGRRAHAWAAGAVPLAVGTAVVVAFVAMILGPAAAATTIGVAVLVPLSAFEAAAPMGDAARQLQRSRSAARRILAMVDDLEATTRPEDATTTPDGTTTALDSDVRPVAGAAPGITLDAGLRWGHAGRPAYQLSRAVKIAPGERVAVVGPTGTGKTSLLLTVAGLLPARSGRCALTVAAPNGDATQPDPATAARWFSSDAHVFATSVRENLLVSCGDAEDSAMWAALATVGLRPWVTDLPHGLDTVLGAGADAMSAGQRRRLLLARALINPASILLLDEPCENLDTDESDRLTAALLDRHSGLVDSARTVIVVTHRLPPSARPDAVIDLG